MDLIGIDLDGTLLDKNQHISSGNAAALRQAQETAMPFICSGRDPEDIHRLLAAAHVALPIVGLNGAVGVTGGRQLFATTFAPATAAAVIAVLAKIPYKVYSPTARFETRDYEASLRALFAAGDADLAGQLPYQLAYDQSVPARPLTPDATAALTKFNVTIPNRRLKASVVAALGKLPGVVTTGSGPANLEVIPQGVGKGLAFGKLRAALALGPGRDVAIGDSENDRSMFAAADVTFAMGNAVPAIRAVATAVVAPHDQDGVAEALRLLATGTGR
ncbi:HAD family hydrolase [Lacticaseibacillus kribbianus]|uniref:HAD family hydrolase n=1 Tax=Lacticaseibacillus kribbianus TaxID=2926292 RepID=UPI001CD60FCB|nr:HAD family hydrolase [Lacticaseibacillus kribbianus]